MTATDNSPEKVIHHGRNVRRFREMFGFKQEALAISLGPDWSQKAVSRLEEKSVIEDDILVQIAQILHVPVEAIKQFDEQTAINIISCTFTSNHSSAQFPGSSHFTYSPTINGLEDLQQLLEENKRLNESLLQSEKEKTALLQRLLDQKG